MPSEQKCRRCGQRAESIDNIIDRSFWGAIQAETETVTTKRLRVLATYIKGGGYGARVSTCDEQQPLCDDCWGLLIGRFMQGRSVPAMAGKEGW